MPVSFFQIHGVKLEKFNNIRIKAIKIRNVTK